MVCACYPAGVTVPAVVQEPTYTCVTSNCGEGQYWCQMENTCKAAGQSCNMGACINGTTTFPSPSSTAVKTYSNSGSFLTETGSTAFGYDNIL